MKFIASVIVAATLAAATASSTTPVAKDPAFKDLELKVDALIASHQIEVRSLKAKIAALEGKSTRAEPNVRRRRVQDQEYLAKVGLAEAQATAEEAAQDVAAAIDIDAGMAEAPQEISDILNLGAGIAEVKDPTGSAYDILSHILNKIQAVEMCVDYEGYYNGGYYRRRLEEVEPEGSGYYPKGTCYFGAKAKKVEINSKELEIKIGHDTKSGKSSDSGKSGKWRKM